MKAAAAGSLRHFTHYPRKELFFFFGNGSSTRNIIHMPNFNIQHFCRFSTSVVENPPPKNTSSMVDYFVESYGFSKDNALTLSTRLNHINDPRKIDSVLSFLKEFSFNETQIRTLINKRTRILFTDVEKLLKPKIRVFQDLGMSDSEIVKLILENPVVLERSVDKHLSPCIDYLRTLLLTDENVIKALKKWGRLTTTNPQKSVMPNVTFLQKCGISDEGIALLIRCHPSIITQKLDWLEEIIKRVRELGVAHDSGLFVHAAIAVSQISRSTLETKFEVFKSFGWSDADILSAFQRSPYCITCSENKLRQKMVFFLNELKLEPSYIARHPKFLSCSLEKRIIPRQAALQILKSKNFLKKDYSFYTLFCSSEKTFLETFVLPHKDKAPDVYEAYVNSKGGVPSMKS